jgi:hypothetical protein
MRSFRRMVRTVCDVRAAAGDLAGGFAVVVRADSAMAPTPGVGALVAGFAREEGIARVHLWTAAARQTPADTAEMRSRGKDQLCAGALVVECLRRGDAERVASALSRELPAGLGISGGHVITVYALLCTHLRSQG